MSKNYNPQRTRKLYDPKDPLPFKISRSKIDLFLQCPRCFYLDRRLGIGRPPSFPFTLNSAVDALLKKEFDYYRHKGQKHPLIEKYGLNARPIPHEELEKWRNNFTGVQFLHKPTNFMVFGAIDDLWENAKGEFMVVDYKSTAKAEEITALNETWHEGYKRQIEVYQWLLRQNGHRVSDTGYFVYCNGRTDREAFGARLEFDLTLIPYTGSDAWVEGVLQEIFACLRKNSIPEAAADCDYCSYWQAIKDLLV